MARLHLCSHYSGCRESHSVAETASHCCSVIGVDTGRSRRHWCCDEMAGTVRASSGRKAFSQCILARREVNQCVFTADDVRLSGLGTNIQAGPFSQTVLVTPVNLSLMVGPTELYPVLSHQSTWRLPDFTAKLPTVWWNRRRGFLTNSCTAGFQLCIISEIAKSTHW